MTYQEALDLTEKTIDSGEMIKYVESYSYFYTVKSALEKQMPKKPKITIYNGYCKCCGLAWGRDRLIDEGRCGYKFFQFCPTCGQAIDWSDDDE